MISHLSAHEEQERILAVFQSGALICKSALFSILHALIGIFLMIVNIVSGIVNVCIGLFTILNAVLSMFKLILMQCQDLIEIRERRMSWTSRNFG